MRAPISLLHDRVLVTMRRRREDDIPPFSFNSSPLGSKFRVCMWDVVRYTWKGSRAGLCDCSFGTASQSQKPTARSFPDITLHSRACVVKSRANGNYSTVNGGKWGPYLRYQRDCHGCPARACLSNTRSELAFRIFWPGLLPEHIGQRNFVLIR